MRPSGPEIAPVGTFPPALSSRIDRCPIRLAFLESQLRRCRWRCVCDRSAAFKRSPFQQIACRRSRLITGMPGGRIALAIRGGRRPRAGGAKPQEAVLFFFLIVSEARCRWVALPLSRFSGQAVRSGGTLVGETTMLGHQACSAAKVIHRSV